jgi:hypothetical protein
MFAAVVVPLFGVFYSPGTPSPRAAFCSVVAGALTRVVLEFSIPKDGFLILPYNFDEFFDYGPAASSLFPVFFDQAAGDLWNPAVEPCMAEQFEDYTGVDSVAAFVASLIAFVVIQLCENPDKPLFSFPGLEAYEKDLGMHKDETIDTKKEEVEA